MKVTKKIVAMSLLAAVEGSLRKQASRVRTSGLYGLTASGSFPNDIPEIEVEVKNQETAIQDQEATVQEMIELLDEYDSFLSMDSDAPSTAPTAFLVTFPPTGSPVDISSAPTPLRETVEPSAARSSAPSMGKQPSNAPSTMASQPPTGSPTASPVDHPSTHPTNFPTNYTTGNPTHSPTVYPDSKAPTESPSDIPTNFPSDIPTNFPSDIPSSVPSDAPFDEPTSVPTSSPTVFPTELPTTRPSSFPTLTGSANPTQQHSAQPSESPSLDPSTFPTTTSPSQGPTATVSPSSGPSLEACFISPVQRELEILEFLEQATAESFLIHDPTTPQGQATQWLLFDDDLQLCPGDEKLLQRWVLAVVYFSTGGDGWFDCHADDATCGSASPFQNQRAFLSATTECNWAGIACNVDECVTEIDFEENNLVGTIPTEMGLLDELVIWGMERGNLTGTIPFEIGELEHLIFIDLDYNLLTGSLPSTLYNLGGLTQLDLNNNFLTGRIDEIGAFTNLEFLQLHTNLFSGTIPDDFGAFSHLHTFTLHESLFTGVIPPGLCDLVDDGTLTNLIADCGGSSPKVSCTCCTVCRP